MKNLSIVTLAIFSITFTACSQKAENTSTEITVNSEDKTETKSNEPHRYGGWYCPDNLNGFPAVDISDWKKVTVVNGRMATKEETQNGTSLIFVDMEKYPNAKPLDMTMPKMATFYNQSSGKEEIIIIIQAINIDNDSIVGFRYLNGGNGSARLSEVSLLSDLEINKIPSTRFVTNTIKIKATQEKIWKVLTETEFLDELQPAFDKENKMKTDWRKTSNVNFCYLNCGKSTASYANLLFGCYYVQNDYTEYNEKFLLLENEETKETELKIVTGPFRADYVDQKEIIKNWAQKVKELSEKE